MGLLHVIVAVAGMFGYVIVSIGFVVQFAPMSSMLINLPFSTVAIAVGWVIHTPPVTDTRGGAT